MEKKLIVIAVAGALGAPLLAFAQASTVQIYGTIRQEYDRVDQGGSTPASAATAAGRPLVTKDFVAQPGGSNIGFKGTESLGGGLNAWFQNETNVQSDGSTGNQLSERNSAVGLNGGWGSILLGQWDTPYKWSTGGVLMDETGITSSRQMTQLGQPTCGNAAAPSTTAITTSGCQYSFGRRQTNSFQYWTPNFSGFEGRIAFSASEEKVTATAAGLNNAPIAGTTGGLVANSGGAYAGSVPAGGTATPRLWSLAGRYENGPLLVAAAWERHVDYTRAGGSDTGWNIAAGYTFAGVVRLSGLYERLSWDVGTAATPLDANHSGWNVNVDWTIAGPHALKFGYGRSNSTGGSAGGANPAGLGAASTANACPGAAGGAFGTNTTGLTAGSACMIGGQSSTFVFNGGAGNTGSQLWNIRYTYDFSKRTQLQASYTILNNDANAIGTILVSGNTASNAGQRQTAMGLGIRHTF